MSWMWVQTSLWDEINQKNGWGRTQPFKRMHFWRYCQPKSIEWTQLKSQSQLHFYSIVVHGTRPYLIFIWSNFVYNVHFILNALFDACPILLFRERKECVYCHLFLTFFQSAHRLFYLNFGLKCFCYALIGADLVWRLFAE